jgi:hypothetical protein
LLFPITSTGNRDSALIDLQRDRQEHGNVGNLAMIAALR